MQYDMIVDGQSLRSHGFLIVKRPDRGTAKKKYLTNEVLAHDGTFYRDTGFFEDEDQTVEFNYLADPELWTGKLRKFREIMDGAKEVLFTDDPHFFRKVKKVEIGSCERPVRRLGKVSAIFTFDPYDYYVPGYRYYRNPEEYRFNPMPNRCRPIYLIDGSGECTLTVNGYACRVIVPDRIYLDCEKQIAYDQGRGNRCANTDAVYEKLELAPGENAISVSSGFSLQVMPNWRSR